MAKPKWTADDMPDQTGRTVFVTGASSGLGLRMSEVLASKGARVVLGCRNPAKAAAALELVQAAARGAGSGEVVAVDFADLSTVRGAAKEVDATYDHLDALVNNAGVMALPYGTTADGFETQFGTNHLGHFAFTGLVLPVLLRAPGTARVVNISSPAHRMGKMNFDDLNGTKRYRKWRAYGQSKLANLLFTFELQRRAEKAGVPLISVAAHPGYSATHLSVAGPELSGNRLGARIHGWGDTLFAQSDAQGALPQLYATTMPDVRGGEYFGPDGLFESRGHPKRVGTTRRARDLEAASRLWTVSQEMTGVSYPL